jgi:hypothetical protein
MREAHEPVGASHQQLCDQPMEASMKTRLVFAALIVGVMTAIAPPSSQSLAQSTDQSIAAPKSAKPNTNMNPQKHRAWRHQGGRHPHFGSRRVRTGAQAARPPAN